MVKADYRSYIRQYGAAADIQEYGRLLQLRANGARINLPAAVTDVFKVDTHTADKQSCRDLVLAYEAAEAGRLQEQLFAQRRRLADAERALQVRATKKAAEDQRIAGNKVAWLLGKLDELKQPAGREEARIFPGAFCPVLVWDPLRGYVVAPMRYQCRPAGKPASYDRQYPGTYNARRDNLTGFWKAQYGKSHALIVASAFYENVDRHRLEGREPAPGEQPENVVLRFAPGNGQLMQIACLWSHWRGPGQDDLCSFAAITDEPPAEVAAAGHDRCIIPLKDEHLAAWLQASEQCLASYEHVLDDRQRPLYVHRLAA